MIEMLLFRMQKNYINPILAKICFCGISNWLLDASKMNRVINIVVEEPDIKHIEETPKEIAINEDIEKQIEKLIISISKTYYYYISEYQPNQGK